IKGDATEAKQLGITLAQELIDKGAIAILLDIKDLGD
ncbi:MAG: hydroxymethylbilane synthase, partial [Syntrophomonadaceae bacterium]|nr:hydroxymethylbilane synthase [Syntrophomonadaceae bacterium]